MKFLIIFVVSMAIAVKGWKQKYGNDFVTYSIGDRYEKGDFLIRNETVESKFSIYNWPRVHRLEFKIENHDDLLSFAQIDIIDTDEPHEVHISTQPTHYEVLIVSKCKLNGLVKVYHKAPENFHHLTKLFPSLFNAQRGRGY
ncbi:unnamed protein product [Chironomus riparius]|uniref:Uncharacterized protein n=1 Tax=Chironomus riparius TaxID=315576 RepID=A0A9N9WXQ7_9DIPT|nr:unnamed protein product [Chironomus riparius]